MGGRTSTTRPKGNGPGHGPSLHGGAKGAGQPQFTQGRQPPPMHKAAGKEARAAYLAKLAERQEAALAVIDRALELGATAEDAPMVGVGLRAAQQVTETLHGRPTQAVTGEDGGPLSVVIRRLVETSESDA